MSMIFGGLGAAPGILHIHQAALELTQRNIANANTVGYTRQRVAITPTTTIGWDTIGMPVVTVENFRDRFIDLRLSRELQGRGEQEAACDALGQVESLLDENAGAGLGKVLSDFFNGFSALANAPEDMNARQAVLTRANALAQEFRRLYGRIQGIRYDQDQAVANAVDEVNLLIGQLADLNVRVSSAITAPPGEQSVLQDQRQSVLNKLSELIDISYYESDSGMLTVTTRSGLPLVVADQKYPLQASRAGAGALYQIVQNGVDISGQLSSGKIGGLLRVRDETLADYLERLDVLAATVVERINTQHSQGSDLNGLPGGNFFVPLPIGSSAGAANSIELAFQDPRLIAAAAAGAGPGSNANAALISALRDQALTEMGGSTFGQYYSQLVYSVGSDLHQANDELTTQEQLLVQLQNQRDSLAGVNLDEEAVNIMRYQKAYEASARMIRVWDEISQDVINTLGG